MGNGDMEWGMKQPHLVLPDSSALTDNEQARGPAATGRELVTTYRQTLFHAEQAANFVPDFQVPLQR